MEDKKVYLTSKQQDFLKHMFETKDLRSACRSFVKILSEERVSVEDYIPILDLIMETYEERYER